MSDTNWFSDAKLAKFGIPKAEPNCPGVEELKKQRAAARKMRDHAMKDIGMVKVKSDSGKVYWE